MSQKGRYLAWVFTINNPTEEDIEKVKNVECRGIKAEHEHTKGEGTPHIQGAICFHSKVSLLTAKKRISERAHLERMMGSWDDQDYCLKEGGDQIIRNEGEGPKQGVRTDIVEFGDAIKNGLTEDEAYDQFPSLMFRYPRFYGGYKDALLQEVPERDWMTEGIWWYGKARTGKTRKAREQYPDAYVWNPSDKGWWDDYNGQETVIIDGFTGNIPYGTLMRLVDRYPMRVPRGWKAPVPFLAKRVIVISNMSPELVYSEEKNIDQLRRRFSITCFNPKE